MKRPFHEGLKKKKLGRHQTVFDDMYSVTYIFVMSKGHKYKTKMNVTKDVSNTPFLFKYMFGDFFSL